MIVVKNMLISSQVLGGLAIMFAPGMTTTNKKKKSLLVLSTTSDEDYY
jgi:hypothetical protein